MSDALIGELTSARPVRVRPAAVARAHSLAGYDLLLIALLGLMTAARLWLVPGYLRADTWLALTVGRDIWASGIPHHETLTALAAGHQWVDQQWLAHLAAYGTYRIGGLGLIAALSVTLAATSFGAVALAARLRGARARTVLMLMPVTAFPFFAQSWQPRTQMFAYPLFAAVFLLLLRDARRHSARVLLVLVLLALWANVHGSAALGAILISLRGCVLAWERRACLGRLAAWRMPVALAVLPPLVLLFTPYGAGTARYYRDTLVDGSFKRLATEWQPITHDPLLLAPFLVLAAMCLWLLFAARRETTLWERVAFVVLLAAAATAVRNMVWLTLGAVPVMAVALNRVIPADAAPSSFGARLNKGLAATAVAAVVVALAVTLARPAAQFERDYPQAYLDGVRTAAAIAPGARIVADVGDADWLLWRDPGLRGRIAFDARLELLSASGVRDITSVLRGTGRRSALRSGAYRVFALDRQAASVTIHQLASEQGRRVMFADEMRVVLLMPERELAR